MTHKLRMSVESNNVAIGGQHIFVGDHDELRQVFIDLLQKEKPALVITPNVDQIIDIASNLQYRQAFDNASLRLLDGMPLVILARLLGARGVRRLTGADMLPWVVEQSETEGWVVAITGGRDDVAQQAADSLQTRFPAAKIRAIPFPVLSAPSDPKAKVVIESLRDLRPDVTFICLGAPKQELWFTFWQDELPDGIYIGAGAAVDFAAGTVMRAPAALQRLSLEWAWRLLQEPRRLSHRYLIKGPRFLGFVYRSIWNSDNR